MTDRSAVYLDETVDAVLVGGPAGLPGNSRHMRTTREVETIKVPHYGGYEHFERAGGTGAHDAPVEFRWTGRTKVAE